MLGAADDADARWLAGEVTAALAGLGPVSVVTRRVTTQAAGRG